jgi:regulator of sigma E protease
LGLIDLIPSFGNLIYTIGAFVIALLIIVAIHEFGHYIVARWTGIHAEVFSLGFGPVLWSTYDQHGTRWQIAALPFGGFVKFLGDADAASGKDAEAIARMDAETRRKSMHSAPLWARTLTVAAGPVFNFVLSIIIFSSIVGYRGVATDPLTIAELRPVPFEQGLMVGDEVLAIAGETTPLLDDFDGFIEKLPIAPILDYTVRREGQELTVDAPFPYPAIVVALTPGSAAMDADMEVGDVILSANGTEIAAFSELRELVGASDGSALDLEIWRNGEVFQQNLQPKRMDLPLQDGGFETRWLIGITGGMAFEPATKSPGPFEAVSYGAKQTKYVITSSLSGLYHVIAGSISSCNIRGPIGIAQTSSAAASQGLLTFIWFIAVLSTAVGLLNLFPVPVLDGGHLVFFAFEAVTGRPPSDGALRVFMMVGLGLILSLMLFALKNDVLCP